jgi:hypothetical protein
VFWTINRVSRRANGQDMGWVDDLVSPDPAQRAAALIRFQQTNDAYWSLQHEINAVWAEAGSADPAKPRLAARMSQLRAAQDIAAGHELMRTLWDGWAYVDGGPEWFQGDPAELIHYSLRYLEWEVHFPGEWHKNWLTKASLLRELARRDDLTDQHRSRLADLVIRVVRRKQRCKDQGYISVARATVDQSLRQRIETEADAADPVTRLRASFMLYMLDHPTLPAKSRTWKRWLANQSTVNG